MLYPLSHKGIKNSPRGSTSERLGPVAGAGSLGGWAKGALCVACLGPSLVVLSPTLTEALST